MITSLEVYMKRIGLVLCSFLGILGTGTAIPSQVNGQAELSTEKLVNALRVINTSQVPYYRETGRFANREEMLSFLRTKGIRSPIDLENPKPYELTITTSPDGMHYQITLKRTYDRNDDSTWGCKTAAFSDDAGVIFLGSALDCHAAAR
jgi:hypothetical protein